MRRKLATSPKSRPCTYNSDPVIEPWVNIVIVAIVPLSYKTGNAVSIIEPSPSDNSDARRGDANDIIVSHSRV